MAKLIRSQVRGYGFAVLTVAIAHGLMLLLDRYAQIDVTTSGFLLFFVPIIVSSLYGGFKPGLLATFLTGLGIGYLFRSPNYLGFSIEEIIRISLFLLAGAGLSALIDSWQNAQSYIGLEKLQTSDRQRQEKGNYQFHSVEQQIETSALKESEKTFRFLADLMPQIVWTSRPDGWVDYYNQRWVEYTGMSLEETQGWGWEPVLHPDDLQLCIDRWRHSFETGEPYEIEYRLKRGADGVYRWHLGSALPMRDENNRIVKWFGTCTDIDDYKQAQTALQQQTIAIKNGQKWLEEVLNLMPIPLLFIEPKTARVTFANKAADELAGGEFPKNIPEEEYHTVYYSTDTKGNPIQNDRQPGVRVARGEKVDGFELNWHTPIGIRSLLIDADTLPSMHGHPATCVLMFQDITKLKQTQDALQQSEARFQRLIESNIIAVVIGNFKGDILEANDAFLDLIAYSRGEMEAGLLRWNDITPPEYLHLDIQGQQQMLSSGVCEPYEKEYIRKDGSRVPILMGVALLEGYNDTAVAFAIDLSERKQMENALRQQAEELTKANRMKDEFLAVVSHELRTPLNSILGWSQMMLARQLPQVTIAKALETIERNARNQKQLIEDLLDVSRIITGKLRLNTLALSLPPIIEAAIATVRPAADAKEISITTTLDAAVGEIKGDEERLQQVIWNLLSNAIKFTPNQGRVEVKLSKLIGNGSLVIGDDNNQLPITNYPPPNTNYAQISVTDSGIGIPSEFLPYVFDRFRQADSTTTRSYGGLGLGLSIVRHLVELHGGSVGVESLGEGKGTTFTVKLPLVKGKQKSHQKKV